MKSDFYRYYNVMQEQYLQMIEVVKEYEELKKEGKISLGEEQKALEMLQPIEANYKRLSYIAYLLQKPRFSLFKKKENTPSLLEYLKGHLLEDVKLENSDCLKLFKETFLKHEN